MAVKDYHRKRKQPTMKKLILFFVFLFCLFFGIFLWWQNGLSAVNPNSTAAKIFVVAKGSSVQQIAESLKEEQLIKNPTIFSFYIKQQNLDAKLQAGSFRLSPAMSVSQIAKMMTTGTLDIWITIPEGKRAEEIADMLSEVMPTYDESWRNALIAEEGYLFPDTYLIPREATVEQVIAIMRNNFDTKFAGITNNTTLDQSDLVILASMIERETRHDEDRPIVSSVMHNRLDINMALQIDATIQYAKGKTGDKWWVPVTREEYVSVKSPYNTYLSPGLPPGPIANPGLKSLEAAANPDDTPYLYYITDKTGVNRYARTHDEHNANINRYGL